MGWTKKYEIWRKDPLRS